MHYSSFWIVTLYKIYIRSQDIHYKTYGFLNGPFDKSFKNQFKMFWRESEQTFRSISQIHTLVSHLYVYHQFVDFLSITHWQIKEPINIELKVS